ncbi:MAG: hypothetical protein ACKO96_42680, partial [Flammeovirgaceae bacterium]
MKSKKFIKTLCPFSLSILAVIIASTGWSQTIRRVNNTGIPLGTNMYETLQAAHNAAAAGDIIYIDGSGANYAGATITKRLTIIGPGYFLGENYNQLADLRPADFDRADIIFAAGSSGSSIIGCTDVYVYVRVSNSTIERNRSITVYFDNTAPINSVLIAKNYSVVPYRLGSNSTFNVTITNNLVTYTSGLSNSNVSGNFSNNVIAAGVNGISLNNFTVSNNIWVSGYYGT